MSAAGRPAEIASPPQQHGVEIGAVDRDEDAFFDGFGNLVWTLSDPDPAAARRVSGESNGSKTRKKRDEGLRLGKETKCPES